MQIGLIGLGAMGLGMARNLAKAKLLNLIYNRTHSKAIALGSELNLSPSTSVQDLAKQCNIILLCVSTDKDVLQIINTLVETVKPKSIVIDLSTVSIETAQKSAAILSKKQVSFLDSPVSGGVEGATTGSLAIMVGGDKEILEKVRPVLDAISSRIVHMGKTGSGQGTKAVNQIMVAGINQAVTEALAFGQAQGLAMDSVIEVTSGGAAGNWFLQNRGKSMVKETFPSGFKLELHHKDLEICKEMAKESGLTLKLVEQTLADYKTLIKQGFANEDISALYRLKKV